jgi:hypothetical protein
MFVCSEEFVDVEQKDFAWPDPSSVWTNAKDQWDTEIPPLPAPNTEFPLHPPLGRLVRPEDKERCDGLVFDASNKLVLFFEAKHYKINTTVCGKIFERIRKETGIAVIACVDVERLFQRGFDKKFAEISRQGHPAFKTPGESLCVLAMEVTDGQPYCELVKIGSTTFAGQPGKVTLLIVFLKVSLDKDSGRFPCKRCFGSHCEQILVCFLPFQETWPRDVDYPDEPRANPKPQSTRNLYKISSFHFITSAFVSFSRTCCDIAAVSDDACGWTNFLVYSPARDCVVHEQVYVCQQKTCVAAASLCSRQEHRWHL